MIIVTPPNGDRRITNAAITQQMTRKTSIPATATATTTKVSLLLSLKLQFHQILSFVTITIIIMTISSSASSSLLSSFYSSGTVHGVRTVGTRTRTRTRNTLPCMKVVSAFTILDSQRNRNKRHVTTMTMKMKMMTTTTTTTTTPSLTYVLPPISTTTTTTTNSNRLHSYSHSYSSSSSSSLSLSSSSSSSSSTDPSVETTTATPTIGTTTTAMMTRIPPNERAKLLNKYLDMILTTTTSTTKPLVVAGSNSSNSNSDSLSTDNYTTTSISLNIMEAALQSFLDPSTGYDAKYGRPALRAYRSFIYPKNKQQQKEKEETPNQEEFDSIQLEGIARRTATQIDFLIKRQTSQRLEAIRNHDTKNPQSTDDTNNNGFLMSDDHDNNTQTQTQIPTTTTTFPITSVLDNIRGAFNVGSIFRTGEACGVSSIITCGITPHPNGSGQEKVAKSALGADYLIHHTQHYATTQQALLDLKKSNKSNSLLPPLVIALETTTVSQLYTDIDYRPYYYNNDSDIDEQQQQETTDTNTDTDTDNSITKGNGRGIIVILGNEVTGVDAELLSPLLVGDGDSDSDANSNNDNSDEHDNSLPSSLSSSSSLVDIIIELPTYGRKNSLNVAAVAPVILYEILRQWNESK